MKRLMKSKRKKRRKMMAKRRKMKKVASSILGSQIQRMTSISKMMKMQIKT